MSEKDDDLTVEQRVPEIMLGGGDFVEESSQGGLRMTPQVYGDPTKPNEWRMLAEVDVAADYVEFTLWGDPTPHCTTVSSWETWCQVPVIRVSKTESDVLAERTKAFLDRGAKEFTERCINALRRISQMGWFTRIFAAARLAKRVLSS